MTSRLEVIEGIACYSLAAGPSDDVTALIDPEFNRAPPGVRVLEMSKSSLKVSSHRVRYPEE
jgi:hypothetical protein